MDTTKINFKIKVGEFEGPLELLLNLIEKRKLHINTISLSFVADEFIEHIKRFEEFPISESTDFIFIASTLLLIKSKSLLPNLEITENESQNISDLEKRLILYKKYKEMSMEIQKIFGNRLYFANESKNKIVFFNPSKDISVNNIENALKTILNNIPKKEEVPQITVKKIISLPEMMERLTERITNSMKTSFKDFSNIGKVEKVNVIVSFLAMLELVKQGVRRVNQENHFSDIDIESESVATPKY